MAEKNLFGGSEREYSHPTVEGPWGRAPNTEPTHAWPVLPAGWNPEGKPGHGPGDIGVLEAGDILKINTNAQPITVYLSLLEIS